MHKLNIRNKLNKILQIVLITSISLLGACQSNVSGDWDCPIQKGGGCSSITANARKAMSTSLKTQENEEAKPKKEVIKQTRLDEELLSREFATRNIDLASDIEDLLEQPSDLTSLRSRDHVSRLWFAPFVDEDDNLHQMSFVYVVDNNSNWSK
jgi:type IV conjugative transfer system lipoprotein TraV